jgi:hypothetical protein
MLLLLVDHFSWFLSLNSIGINNPDRFDESLVSFYVIVYAGYFSSKKKGL